MKTVCHKTGIQAGYLVIVRLLFLYLSGGSISNIKYCTKVVTETLDGDPLSST